MEHGITRIDHPVIAVRDMVLARRAYERLGFTVPPRGSHLEWGTGNWCIMFPEDYLELRGILDPVKYTHGLDEFLKHREGLMGVAFGTANAEASATSLSEHGIANTVRRLTRNFELPDGNVPLSFVLCFPDSAATPGLMSVVLCEHLTPHQLRRPGMADAPEWSSGRSELTRSRGRFACDCDAYRRLFGAQAVVQDNDQLIVRVGTRQSIFVRSGVADGDRLSLGLPNEGAAGLTSLELETQSIDATAAWFDDQGVRFTELTRDRIQVPPPEACGVLLEFRQVNDCC